VRGANYTVLGMASGMPESDELGRAVQGSVTNLAAQGRVVLGRAAADTLDLQPGQLFSFFRHDLSLKAMTVAGIFRAETEPVTADLIAMPIADARDLFGIPATHATDLCVYVANPAEIATIAEKISQLLPDTRVVTRSQIQKTYQVVFGWRSGFASVCLLAALAAFAILAWDKASGLSPEERREIAILKILGWETSDVLALRFWEGGLVAGLAFLLGTTLAYLHVVFGGAALFKPVMVGWSVLRPTLSLAPQVTAKEVLLLLAFTVLPYLAVTVIPAWRAASVPAESALSG
jgi:ABC-type lipoprotein release transport system permease subunit